MQKLACLTVALTGSTDLPVPTSGQCGKLSRAAVEDADDLSAVGASAQAIVHADDKLAAVAGDGPGAAWTALALLVVGTVEPVHRFALAVGALESF